MRGPLKYCSDLVLWCTKDFRWALYLASMASKSSLVPVPKLWENKIIPVYLFFNKRKCFPLIFNKIMMQIFLMLWNQIRFRFFLRNMRMIVITITPYVWFVRKNKNQFFWLYDLYFSKMTHSKLSAGYLNLLHLQKLQCVLDANLLHTSEIWMRIIYESSSYFRDLNEL